MTDFYFLKWNTLKLALAFEKSGVDKLVKQGGDNK